MEENVTFILFFWACSDKTTDSGTSTTTDTAQTTTTVECASLGAEECGTAENCTELQAYALNIDDQNMCYELETSTTVGCIDIEQPCGDAITFAENPDGEIYWFSSTCTPSGWTEAQALYSYQEGCEVPDCYALSVDACALDDSCTYITGFERIENAAEECYALEEATPISCMPIQEACEPVVVNMQHPETGSCYQINHGCTPSGWSYCEDINQTWPECPAE